MIDYTKIYDENGNYITNPEYTEIIKLHKMLEEAGIPHTFKKFMDGWQVCYPTDEDKNGRIADAVEHYGSYGKDDDLLEIMGLLTEEEREQDGVLGYLTAENVFKRMNKHWEGVNHED